MRGFSLTEMIVTIAVVGLLAAVAIPRFVGKDAFEARGFYDEVLSAARYAQKFAVVTGCEVQFSISGGAYILNQRAIDCTTGAFTRPVVHPGSRDAAGFSGTAPSGITFSISANPVVFSALGTVFDGATRTVTVGSRSFQIIGATGFVQEGP